jgi:hypothetical protein
MADLGGLACRIVSRFLMGRSGRRLRIQGWSGIRNLGQDARRVQAVGSQVPERFDVRALDDQAVVLNWDRCGVVGRIQKDQAATIGATDFLDRLQAHSAGKVDHDGVDLVLPYMLPALHAADLGEAVVRIKQRPEGRCKGRILTEENHMANHRSALPCEDGRDAHDGWPLGHDEERGRYKTG